MAQPVVTKTNQAIPQVRAENLPFVFQEVLTAIGRLRTNRQSVSDAGLFRNQVKQALALADKEARALGYSPDSIRLAVFAAVAFVDESVLNQPVPTFADWARKPLQEELFGVHTAGEMFFENLQRLLVQPDSPEFADVLEVYELCLLLGYRGRYGAAAKGDVTAIIRGVDDKVRRVRGRAKDISPNWALPQGEALPIQNDRWGRYLLFAFAGCLILAFVFYVGFRFSLASDLATVKTVISETGKRAF